MSSQSYEILKHKGRIRGIKAEPLGQYFDLMEMIHPFLVSKTNKGYTGSWEIINNKLYLTHLRGISTAGKHLRIKDLFSGQIKVMAAWFTGYIECWENHNLDNKGPKEWHFHELNFQLGHLMGDRIITAPKGEVAFRRELSKLFDQ